MSKIQSVLFNKNMWTKSQSIAKLKHMKLKNIKPVHETANFYRYRIINPSKFSRFRVIKLRHGIEFVIGFY
jgi:hypothetical protein